jgi:uncharacterized protein
LLPCDLRLINLTCTHKEGKLPLLARNIKCAIFTSCMLISASSWASDIQCARTQQPAQRIICDHAILNSEYDDIYEQQQKLIQQGKLTTNNLIAWQQKRDACTDVHCMDVVFAEWSTINKSLESVATVPAMTASEALGTPLASSLAAEPGQQASGVPVSRQGSAYGVALPQAVTSDASAPVPAVAASTSTHTRGGIMSDPLLIVLGILLVIAALSVGGMMVYQRRREDK